MPYQDPEKQKAAQRRSYQRNKETIAVRQREQRVEINKRLKESRAALREWIISIKAMTPCTDCGLNYPYYVMDFDHVRGLKLANISKLMAQVYSRAVIQAEIDKCDVVCANCHRERTHQRVVVV